MLNRREVLQITAAAGALPWGQVLAGEAEPASDRSVTVPIIDTNVSLFQWPFRRLPLDETNALSKKLRFLGVTQAWAGSFDALLHRDLAGVNQRLVDACQAFPELVPIGAVNPALPGWKADLRQCVETHRMPGVRLLPGYHGYSLDDPRFVELLVEATVAGLFVQVVSSLEDTRTQSDLVRVGDVDLSPLVRLLPEIPKARVQILNHKLRAPLLGQLANVPGVYCDTARVDGTDGVPSLVKSVPSGRVLFGSHAPFLIPEAALIRTHESGQLDDAALRAVLSENAEAFRESSS
jgi:predicted TIM-barrel fold metal-dependent hydrolase